MTTPQLDLFSAPPAPLQQRLSMLLHTSDRPRLADILPRRPTIAWERRLARAGGLPLELLVSAHWTGIVTEVLSLPAERVVCHADGVIQDGLPRDGRLYRSVFVSPTEARTLGRRVPLALLGSPGTTTIRLAEAATPADAWAELGEWLDGIEAEGKAGA